MAKKASLPTENALAKFEESFTKDMGVQLERSDEIEPYRAISTGSLNLDAALTVGGYVEGRVHEIHGPEHVGKTTLCVLAAVEAQRKHPRKMVGLVDMEQTFDRTWARALGLDLNRLWQYTPKTAEDTADAIKRFVESGLCSIVIVDSIGSMISRAEFEKEADDAVVANVARIVTRMVKQASPLAWANGTAVIVVNQVRANITKFGKKTTEPGGWALKHITTIKMEARSGSTEPKTVKVPYQDQPIPVSFEIAVKIEKNKTAPKGKVATFWLTNQATEKWGPIGIDKVQESFDFGKRFGIIEQGGGGYFTLPDGERVRGGDTAVQHLRDNPVLVEQIRDQVLQRLSGELIVDDTPPVVEAIEGLSDDEALDTGSGEIVSKPDFAAARHGA